MKVYCIVVFWVAKLCSLVGGWVPVFWSNVLPPSPSSTLMAETVPERVRFPYQAITLPHPHPHFLFIYFLIVCLTTLFQ
jgi:hypothetical protein